MAVTLDKDPIVSNDRLIGALNTCNVQKGVAVATVSNLRRVLGAKKIMKP